MIHVINSHIISFFSCSFKNHPTTADHYHQPTLKNVFNETHSRLFCSSVCCEAYRFYVLRSKRWKNSMFIEKILLSCSIIERTKRSFSSPTQTKRPWSNSTFFLVHFATAATIHPHFHSFQAKERIVCHVCSLTWISIFNFYFSCGMKSGIKSMKNCKTSITNCLSTLVITLVYRQSIFVSLWPEPNAAH